MKTLRGNGKDSVQTPHFIVHSAPLPDDPRGMPLTHIRRGQAWVDSGNTLHVYGPEGLSWESIADEFLSLLDLDEASAAQKGRTAVWIRAYSTRITPDAPEPSEAFLRGWRR